MLYEHFVLKHLDVNRDKPVVPFFNSRDGVAAATSLAISMNLPDDCYVVLERVVGRAVGGAAQLCDQVAVTLFRAGYTFSVTIAERTTTAPGLHILSCFVESPILVPGLSVLTVQANFNAGAAGNLAHVDVFGYLIPILKI